LSTRIEVVRRRDDYERDPEIFVAGWKRDDVKLRRKIEFGRTRLTSVKVSDAALTRASELSLLLGTDGLRGELTLIRAARAFAALEGDTAVADTHLRYVAPSAMRHRLRRNPLDDAGSTTRVERAILEMFGT